MNKALASNRSTTTASSSNANFYSDFMLFELLAMHEELIGQLRLESHAEVSANGTELLSDLLHQHVNAAGELRELLLEQRNECA